MQSSSCFWVPPESLSQSGCAWQQSCSNCAAHPLTPGGEHIAALSQNVWPISWHTLRNVTPPLLAPGSVPLEPGSLPPPPPHPRTKSSASTICRMENLLAEKRRLDRF